MLKYSRNAKKILDYRIIIEPEKQGKKTVYNAYCPSLGTLGVADYGNSIDEVLKSIKDGIELALKRKENLLKMKPVKVNLNEIKKNRREIEDRLANLNL